MTLSVNGNLHAAVHNSHVADPRSNLAWPATCRRQELLQQRYSFTCSCLRCKQQLAAPPALEGCLPASELHKGVAYSGSSCSTFCYCSRDQAWFHAELCFAFEQPKSTSLAGLSAAMGGLANVLIHLALAAGHKQAGGLRRLASSLH